MNGYPDWFVAFRLKNLGFCLCFGHFFNVYVSRPSNQVILPFTPVSSVETRESEDVWTSVACRVKHCRLRPPSLVQSSPFLLSLLPCCVSPCCCVCARSWVLHMCCLCHHQTMLWHHAINYMRANLKVKFEMARRTTGCGTVWHRAIALCPSVT